MSPATHLLVGWVVATASPLPRRDRVLIAVAAVAPDFDGLGLVADLLTRHSAQPLDWWDRYHHVLGHNVGFALLLLALSAVLARNRAATPWLVLLSVHLHFLCDLAGSRGPDGELWTIPYLLPFSSAGVWSWAGQWKLNSWQNLLVTVAALAWMFRAAWRSGHSPLELVSTRANEVFVRTLRTRFPLPPGPS